MAFRSLLDLRSRLLNFSNLTRESSTDGQTFIQSFFQRTVVDGAPAFVFNNDFVRFLNFGSVETQNADAAIEVGGEDANIINFSNGSIDADSGPDAQATAIDVTGSAAIRNFGSIEGEFNGVSFSGPNSSGQLDNFSSGRISSDSRAVNIQGQDVSVRNFGEIVGTGDQRNGTIYTDGSADNFSIGNFRGASIDAGEGNQGAGISLEIGDEEGETTSGTITNNFGATIQGRGQAASNTALAGDGIRVNNGEAGTTFDGNIVNSGLVSSESDQGTTAGLRVADGVAFDGSIVNTSTGVIEGARNGLYIGNAEHDLDIVNAGTIQSGSRAVNIDGSNVDLVNNGQILGTGDQRNGTVYADDTATDYSITNGRPGTIDAGVGNQGAGISLSLAEDGNGSVEVVNAGTIAGRGQASAAEGTAGDGIRLEGVRADGGFGEALFNGTIVNSGEVTSESTQGTTGAFRAVNNVNFQGQLVNEADGVFAGAQNGVYFGTGDHTGGVFTNEGLVSSDSRAVNIDGSGLTVQNDGQILGTGDQRNGTVYADDTATDYTLNNGSQGSIDAGEGNDGAGVSLSLAEAGNGNVTIVNDGTIAGRGQASAAAGTAGDGIRLEGVRADGGFNEALFNGTIVNSGEVTSESNQGTTGAFRAVNNVNFQGLLVNEEDGIFAGANNGVYFGTGDHTGGAFVNQGLVSSDSRAVNVDGSGLTVANEGQILGTGDQRNGTVYADDTATDYTIANGPEGSIDAGEGNNGAGISLSLAEGGNGNVVVDNAGTIAGRGQASPAGGTAGDGIRLEGVRVADGFAEALFEGQITNSGTVTSESTQGTTGAFRAVNNVNFRGQLVNEQGGVFAGAQNGVYFGTGDHTGGEFINRGLVTSDSRAVNIDGSGLTVVNEGQILGTGDQRNGTVYADGTADDYTLINEASGVIDAGEGNNGSGVALQTGDVVGDIVNANVLNDGIIQGRGESDSANLVGNGVRVFAGSDVAGTTSLAGNIVNDGLIAGSEDSALAAGISIESGVDILGAIINTGEIRGVENAIDAREGGSVNLVNDGIINGNVLLGGENDIVISSQGTINGIVDGGAGNDVVLAGAEDNVLVGGLGNDILIGGDGVDTARFDDLDVGIVANLQSGTVSRDGFAADVAQQTLVNPNLGGSNNLAPAAILSAAIAGNIYFNVHTSAFPSGEVRGQLELVSDVTEHGTRTVTLSAALDGDQEVPAPTDTPATGTADVVFTVSPSGEISYETDLDVSNLQGDLLPVNIGNGTLSPIHLHNAPAGQNGPVVVDVASDAGDGLVIVDETDVLIDIENIVGSGGDDLVIASEFSSVDGVIDGGEGLDTVDFSGFSSGVSVDLDLNTPQPGPASQDGALVTQVGPNGEVIQEFDNFENVIGSNFDDVIFGNNEINVLEGGAGNDLIHSFGGADVLDGGEGIDTALFSASPVGVTVDLDEEGNAVSSFGDTLISFENVNGSVAGNDDISGNSGANVLNGQGGNDTLTGEGGDDILIGGDGHDTFVFAFGSDDDTVSDFQDGQDRLDVGGFGHDFDIAGAISGAVQDGDDTVITLSDSDSVRLAGFEVADLNEQDFIA